MPKTGNIEAFSAIFPRFLGSIKGKKKYLEQLVFFNWEKIVGPDVAKHVRPDRFSFNTLFLSADSPVWANQLIYLKEEIIGKINQLVQENLVKEIRFNAAGRLKDLKFAGKKINKSEIDIVPNEKEQQKAVDVCNKITDERLRKAASKALAADLAKNRWRLDNGWHQCNNCQRLISKTENLCTDCERKIKKQRIGKIREILTACPWSKYADIYNYVPCTAQEANGVRAQMLQQLAGKIVYEDQNQNSLEMKTLVMLADSVPYEKIDEERIKRVAKRFRWMMIKKEKGEF